MSPAERDPSSTAIKISIDEIDDYYSCSAYYGYRWYYGLVPNEEDIPDILYSQALIKAAKDIALGKKDNPNTSWKEMRPLWDTALDNVVPLMSGKGWTKLSYYARGSVILQRYFESLHEVMFVDKPYEILVKPGVYVTGTIDVWHEKPAKLHGGHRPPFVYMFNNGKYWGANKDSHTRPKFAVAPTIPYFFKKRVVTEILDTNTGAINRAPFPKTGTVEQAKHLLKNAVDAILKRQYYPRPYSEVCDRCPFKNSCSAIHFRPSTMDKTTPEKMLVVFQKKSNRKRLDDGKRLARRLKPRAVPEDKGPK